MAESKRQKVRVARRRCSATRSADSSMSRRTSGLDSSQAARVSDPLRRPMIAFRTMPLITRFTHIDESNQKHPHKAAANGAGKTRFDRARGRLRPRQKIAQLMTSSRGFRRHAVEPVSHGARKVKRIERRRSRGRTFNASTSVRDGAAYAG